LKIPSPLTSPFLKTNFNSKNALTAKSTVPIAQMTKIGMKTIQYETEGNGVSENGIFASNRAETKKMKTAIKNRTQT